MTSTAAWYQCENDHGGSRSRSRAGGKGGMRYEKQKTEEKVTIKGRGGEGRGKIGRGYTLAPRAGVGLKFTPW